MDFGFSDEQQQIKATARELLAERSPFPRVRAAAEAGADDAGLWDELRGLGWPGIAVSEAHGGQGLGTVELAILLEELGYAVAATPFLGTALAALALEHAGSDAQRERWLPGLASGELTGGFGRAGLAADAQGAAVIVLVGADGRARVLDGADAVTVAIDAIDPTRRYARVEGDGAPLGEGVAERAAGALAAELVGVCQRALDMTLAYVKERRQFGVPVGSFQAVQHRCAEMLLHTESARSAAYFAAWAADAAPDRLDEAAGIARAASGEAGQSVTGSAIQAHGGIGFTWEADVHWLFKRAQLDAALLGGASAARMGLARARG